MYPQHQSGLSSVLHSEYARQLATLLAIIIALGLAYGAVPTQYESIRGFLAFVQFVFMAITMGITIRRVLEDF